MIRIPRSGTIAYAVLLRMARLGRRPVSPLLLSHALRIDVQSARSTLATLEARGLVVYVDQDNDNPRHTTWALTRAARKAVRARIAAESRAVRAAMGLD